MLVLVHFLNLGENQVRGAFEDRNDVVAEVEALLQGVNVEHDEANGACHRECHDVLLSL